MKKVFKRPRGTLGKWNGVKYWKDSFTDLKPFDILDIDDVLTRYKSTLESFDECLEQQKNGHYFLKITEDQLDHPEVKRLHEKFNHKSVDVNNSEIIKFAPYGKKPHERSYKWDHIIEDRPNFQLRDGKVTPGFGTWDWKNYFNREEKGMVSRNNIYLEIPHEVISENLVSLNGKFYQKVLPKNGIEVIKKFIEEVETNGGEYEKHHAHPWKDTEKVNKIIDKYDEKYPDWNFEFPIYSYSTVKQNGLLFPIFHAGNPYYMTGTGLHRLIMPAYAKSNVPMILPLPADKNDLRYFVYSMGRDFRKIDNKYSFLLIDVNIESKKLVFYLSPEPSVNPKKIPKLKYKMGRITHENFNEWKTEYIGECEF